MNFNIIWNLFLLYLYSFLIGWGAISLLKWLYSVRAKIWVGVVFLISFIALVLWVGFQESIPELGLLVGLIGAGFGAYRIAKKTTGK